MTLTGDCRATAVAGHGLSAEDRAPRASHVQPVAGLMLVESERGENADGEFNRAHRDGSAGVDLHDTFGDASNLDIRGRIARPGADSEARGHNEVVGTFGIHRAVISGSVSDEREHPSEDRAALDQGGEAPVVSSADDVPTIGIHADRRVAVRR